MFTLMQSVSLACASFLFCAACGSFILLIAGSRKMLNCSLSMKALVCSVSCAPLVIGAINVCTRVCHHVAAAAVACDCSTHSTLGEEDGAIEKKIVRYQKEGVKIQIIKWAPCVHASSRNRRHTANKTKSHAVAVARACVAAPVRLGLCLVW